MTPAVIVGELTYRCYEHNRDLGMSAERLAHIFPETGAAMESRYRRERPAAVDVGTLEGVAS